MLSRKSYTKTDSPGFFQFDKNVTDTSKCPDTWLPRISTLQLLISCLVASQITYVSSVPVLQYQNKAYLMSKRAQHNSNLYSLKTDSCWRREQSITQNLCSFLSLFSTWHSVFSIGLTIFVATLATPFLTTLMLRTRLLPRKSLLKIFFFHKMLKTVLTQDFVFHRWIAPINCADPLEIIPCHEHIGVIETNFSKHISTSIVRQFNATFNTWLYEKIISR